jgi:DNA-binding MarR family transcriptional regulator
VQRNIHEYRLPAGVRADARRLRELFLGFSRRRSLRDPLAAMCEAAGLTAPQVHALLWLGQEGPLTMGELSRRVGVTEKTGTGLVDRLERERYLERERDPDDRRVVRSRLTARGAAAYRELDAAVQDKLARLLGLLDAADRRSLFRILETLLARLEPGPGPLEDP